MYIPVISPDLGSWWFVPFSLLSQITSFKTPLRPQTKQNPRKRHNVLSFSCPFPWCGLFWSKIHILWNKKVHTTCQGTKTENDAFLRFHLPFGFGRTSALRAQYLFFYRKTSSESGVFPSCQASIPCTPYHSCHTIARWNLYFLWSVVHSFKYLQTLCYRYQFMAQMALLLWSMEGLRLAKASIQKWLRL